MKTKKLIKPIGLLLILILALIYRKPLLHLVAWLLILYWVIRFTIRVVKLLTPLLIFILVLYIILT